MLSKLTTYWLISNKKSIYFEGFIEIDGFYPENYNRSHLMQSNIIAFE